MATQQIDSQREGAEVEVYHGAEICKQKCRELLDELHLPRGLLPLSGMEEVGRNKATGYVWLRQAKPTTHVFKKIRKTVWYAEEVTAFVEDRKMMQMTGVKSKELLIWVSLSEMVADSEGRRVTFRTAAGLGRSFSFKAFMEEEEEEEEKQEDN